MSIATDTEIKLKGMEALISALGEVEAEKFISLILREPFDYSEWQSKNFTDQISVRDLSAKAMANVERNR
tara:strand:+ start:314 stop:523 length:210 start_codon:yes stop_codon:yes gene_type:complete